MEIVFDETNLQIKKCYYKKNNSLFALFCRVENNIFKDVFTQETKRESEFVQIFYHEINKKFLLYIKKLYKNNTKFKHVKVTSLVDSESIIYNPFSQILRFFSITEEQIMENKSSKKEIQRISQQCFKYASRYIEQKTAKIYYKQILKFDSIKNILSFCPHELNYYFFWTNLLRVNNVEYNQSINNLSLLEVFTLNKYKKCIFTVINEGQLAFNEVKNNLLLKQNNNQQISEKKLQTYVLKLLKQHIRKAEHILAKETKYAIQTNDRDLKKELEIISDELNKIIVNNLNEVVSTFTKNTQLKNWWPYLLYPIPYTKINNYINKQQNLALKKQNKQNEKIKAELQVLTNVLKKLL